MVERVLAALRATPDVARIVLAGPASVPPAIAAAATMTVAATGGLLDTLWAGLAALGGEARPADARRVEAAPAPPGGASRSGRVLVAAADVPLLTSAAVAAFLDAAEAADADVAYAIVAREDLVRAFPGVRKTFVRLADGVFTGGSLVLLRPAAFVRARPLLERAVRARKRPWDLARLFGLGTLVGLATGRLRIAALERRAEVVAGLRARAIICRDAGVALDVDTPEILEVVRARLAPARDAAVPAGRGVG